LVFGKGEEIRTQGLGRYSRREANGPVGEVRRGKKKRRMEERG